MRAALTALAQILLSSRAQHLRLGRKASLRGRAMESILNALASALGVCDLSAGPAPQLRRLLQPPLPEDVWTRASSPAQADAVVASVGATVRAPRPTAVARNLPPAVTEVAAPTATETTSAQEKEQALLTTYLAGGGFDFLLSAADHAEQRNACRAATTACATKTERGRGPGIVAQESVVSNVRAHVGSLQSIEPVLGSLTGSPAKAMAVPQNTPSATPTKSAPNNSPVGQRRGVPTSAMSPAGSDLNVRSHGSDSDPFSDLEAFGMSLLRAPLSASAGSPLRSPQRQLSPLLEKGRDTDTPSPTLLTSPSPPLLATRPPLVDSPAPLAKHSPPSPPPLVEPAATPLVGSAASHARKKLDDHLAGPEACSTAGEEANKAAKAMVKAAVAKAVEEVSSVSSASAASVPDFLPPDQADYDTDGHALSFTVGHISVVDDWFSHATASRTDNSKEDGRRATTPSTPARPVAARLRTAGAPAATPNRRAEPRPASNFWAGLGKGIEDFLGGIGRAVQQGLLDGGGVGGVACASPRKTKGRVMARATKSSLETFAPMGVGRPGQWPTAYPADCIPDILSAAELDEATLIAELEEEIRKLRRTRESRLGSPSSVSSAGLSALARARGLSTDDADEPELGV